MAVPGIIKPCPEAEFRGEIEEIMAASGIFNPSLTAFMSDNSAREEFFEAMVDKNMFSEVEDSYVRNLTQTGSLIDNHIFSEVKDSHVRKFNLGSSRNTEVRDGESVEVYHRLM